jgi:3-oxoacyl-[acyl-carrier protein] reductase
MSKELDGKVAVVTGASKGIGAGIAKLLGDKGAAVVVNYSTSKEGANGVVSEITRNGGKAVAIQANVSKKKEIERLFDEAQKAFGRLDILINNAGIYEFGPLEEVTEELFHRQFDLNVLGLILCSQQAAKRFGPQGGSIVNISSIGSFVTPPNAVIYAATKAAVDAVTKSLAKELGPRKIRVNAVNPGIVVTEGVIAAGIPESDARRYMESHTPLGRIGEVKDVAPAVVFLASPEADWITGETLAIAGGLK